MIWSKPVAFVLLGMSLATLWFSSSVFACSGSLPTTKDLRRILPSPLAGNNVAVGTIEATMEYQHCTNFPTRCTEWIDVPEGTVPPALVGHSAYGNIHPQYPYYFRGREKLPLSRHLAITLGWSDGHLDAGADPGNNWPGWPLLMLPQWSAETFSGAYTELTKSPFVNAPVILWSEDIIDAHARGRIAGSCIIFPDTEERIPGDKDAYGNTLDFVNLRGRVIIRFNDLRQYFN